jgi:hypothetical protein
MKTTQITEISVAERMAAQSGARALRAYQARSRRKLQGTV